MEHTLNPYAREISQYQTVLDANGIAYCPQRNHDTDKEYCVYLERLVMEKLPHVYDQMFCCY